MFSLFSALQHSLNERWPVTKRINNQNYRDTKHRLGEFAKAIPDCPCDDLTLDGAMEKVQTFLDKRRADGCSGTTVDNDRKILSAAFTFLIQRKLVTFRTNPAFKKMVHTAPVITKCKPPASDRDLDALLLASRDSVIYPYVLLCLGVGLRPIGAARIDPERDLDLHGRTARITEKNRERIVPLSQWFIKELNDYRERGHKWQRLHKDTVTHKLKTLRQTAMIPPYVTMQSLRRTFLKKLFTNDVSPQLAARLAGNSIKVIQKHYVELETLNATAVVDVLDFSKKG